MYDPKRSSDGPNPAPLLIKADQHKQGSDHQPSHSFNLNSLPLIPKPRHLGHSFPPKHEHDPLLQFVDHGKAEALGLIV
jgi:hypothetical protein